MMENKYLPRLEGKIAVITGGAQGLGEALSIRLHEEGAKVVIADIKQEQLSRIASTFEDILAVKTDVTKYSDCEKMAESAIDKFGRIDILVCNAGILIAKPIDECTTDEWRRVIEVNLVGFFNSAKAVVPVMKKNTKGKIIQINSKSGKKGSAKNSAYAASKFGGIGLVQSLALELAPYSINVNAICPGNLLDSPLWTEGPDSLFNQYARNQGITAEEVRRKYIDAVPLKRGCTYDDIANVLVFLASRESDYMTGQAINVTGGQEMG